MILFTTLRHELSPCDILIIPLVDADYFYALFPTDSCSDVTDIFLTPTPTVPTRKEITVYFILHVVKGIFSLLQTLLIH